jgi:hypothetical protein
VTEFLGQIAWYGCFVFVGFLAGWAYATRVTKGQRPRNGGD